jgi:hypothetical protein
VYVVVEPKLSVRDARPSVTVVALEEITEYVESAALVAVTRHVPVDVEFRLPAVTLHPVAVPFVTE